jgi:MFS family permease
VALARELEDRGVRIDRVVIGGHFPAPRLPGRFFGLLRRLFPLTRWTSKRASLDFLRTMGFFTETLTEPQKDFLMRGFLYDAAEGEEFYTAAYADPAYPKLSAPLVSVVGEADRLTELYQERYREWEYFAGSVSVRLIPRAGHYFQKHQAAELAAIIVEERPAPGRNEGASAYPEKATAPLTAGEVRADRGPRPRLGTFFAVAAGQFVSLVGTGLTTFALSLWVYQRTDSISLFAVTAMLALLPAVVLAPIAGAAADRWDRRKIMIAADTFAATGSATLGVLALTGQLALWHVYLVVSIGAVATAFQQPAYAAAITQLVPKRYYGRANGLTQLGGAAGTILAPLLGAAVYLAIGLRGVVVIDLCSFAVAVAVTLRVRFPDTMFVRREEPFRREVTGGWRYIARRPGLLAIIGLTALLNYLFAMVEVLATPLTLALGDPTVLGRVLAASGAGLLAGSVAMSVWGGTARRTTGILASFVLIGSSMVVLGARPDPVFPTLGLFGMGLATAFINAHWMSIVQAKVGLELQGRVIATTLMLSWAMVPAGFLSAGPLADDVFEPLMAEGGRLAGLFGPVLGGTGPGRGIGLLVAFAGLGAMLLGAVAFAYRPVRRLEDDLPDAIPDAVVVRDKDALQRRLDAQLAAAPGSR